MGLICWRTDVHASDHIKFWETDDDIYGSEIFLDNGQHPVQLQSGFLWAWDILTFAKNQLPNCKMARPCDITHLEAVNDCYIWVAVNNYGIQLVMTLSTQPLPAQPLPVRPKMMLHTLHSTQLEESASQLSVSQLSAFAFCIPFVWQFCFGLALAPVPSLILLLLRFPFLFHFPFTPFPLCSFILIAWAKTDSPRCSTTSDCFGNAACWYWGVAR